MKLVVHLSDFGWPVPTDQLAPLLADVATLTESAGFDGLAVADHLWQHPIMGGPERACLEAYTTLAFLAAHTRDVRLLTLATGAHFRHPGVLAKTVTTLDVLSGGRAWLGVGAGHYQEECDGLGVPYPPPALRRGRHRLRSHRADLRVRLRCRRGRPEDRRAARSVAVAR